MCPSLLLATCIFLLARTSQALLGDTRDTAEARYGLPKSEKTPLGASPLVSGGHELVFEYQGCSIRCALLEATDGQRYVVREEYRKLWDTAIAKKGGSPAIQDFERDAVLLAETGKSPWRLGSPDFMGDSRRSLPAI